MRGNILLLAIISTTACSGPKMSAAKACESVIALGEKYASTMSVVESEVSTNALSADEIAQQLAGSVLSPMTFGELDKKLSSTQKLSLTELLYYPEGNGDKQARFLKSIVEEVRSAPKPGLLEVDLSYDVDNGNGVPERKKGSCRFLASNVDAKTPIIDFEVAAKLEAARQRAFGPVNFPNKGGKCCVPQFALAQFNPATAKINMQTGEMFGDSVLGGVVMMDEIERAVAVARSSQGLGQ